MTEKRAKPSDLSALAVEACDIWQEQLSNFSKDPAMRAELTRFLEPQRRLFADWAAMMQQRESDHAQTDLSGNEKTSPTGHEAPQTSTESTKPTVGEAAVTEAASIHANDPFRVADLAIRLAEIERRVAKLESLVGPRD